MARHATPSEVVLKRNCKQITLVAVTAILFFAFLGIMIRFKFVYSSCAGWLACAWVQERELTAFGWGLLTLASLALFCACYRDDNGFLFLNACPGLLNFFEPVLWCLKCKHFFLRSYAQAASLMAAVWLRDSILVRASYLVKLSQQGKTLPRRQDVPEDATIHSPWWELRHFLLAEVLRP